MSFEERLYLAAFVSFYAIQQTNHRNAERLLLHEEQIK